MDYVLGITKAYTTRVGGGPFPTELFDETGAHLAKAGFEFGSTTGRPRRCGWFDAAALRRAVHLNSVTGLCITKLDVLDELEVIRICTGYLLNGESVDQLPSGSEAVAQCEPQYIEMPGWKSSTQGVRSLEELPQAARAYLDKLQELVEAPITIVSTGADRNDTILLRDPFLA